MLSVYLLGFVQGGALLIFAAGTGGSPALSPHNLLPLRVFAKFLHGSSPPTHSQKWTAPPARGHLLFSSHPKWKEFS